MMKKSLSILSILVFGLTSVWGYTPTNTDTQLINKISTLMQDVEQSELNQIKTFLENVQPNFDEDSKKYRLATKLIEEVEKIGAWRSLANTFVSTSAGVTGEAVKNGDTISVDYIGSLTDGSIFDTSLEQIAIDAGLYNPARPYDPLGFTVGAGEMIVGFDTGVVGMRVGETKTLTIPPEQAYGKTGSHRLAGETLVFEVTVVSIK